MPRKCSEHVKKAAVSLVELQSRLCVCPCPHELPGARSTEGHVHGGEDVMGNTQSYLKNNLFIQLPFVTFHQDVVP